MTTEEIQIRQIEGDMEVIQKKIDELPKSRVNIQERKEHYEDMLRELRAKKRFWERRSADDQRRN